MDKIRVCIREHKVVLLFVMFLIITGCAICAGIYDQHMYQEYQEYNTVVLKKAYKNGSGNVIELGSRISVDPSTYVNAKYDVTGIAKVDASKVDTDKVGTYPLYITCGDAKKKITIKVKDTVAPTITLAAQKTYQSVGTSLPVSGIISSVTELSGRVSFEFSDGNYNTSSNASKTVNGVKFADVGVRFQDPGERTIELKVTDESGNSSSASFLLVTTGAPAFQGLSEMSVEQGTAGEKIDFITGVKATDEVDGDISSKIQVDKSTLDTSKIGDYTIKYSVVNSMNVTGNGDRTVHVVAKKEAEASKSGNSSAKKSTSSGSGNSGSSGSAGSSSASKTASAQSTNSTSSLQSVSLIGSSMGCEAEVVQYVNNERTAAGLQSVTEDPILDKLAAIRAGETVSLFSHTRPDGRGCFTVFSDYGVTYHGAGENIAAGHENANQVMYMNEDSSHIGWMYSPGHKANIMNGSYTKIGVAARYVEGSTYKYYWCQLFTYD